jgi:hypothetical protein
VWCKVGADEPRVVVPAHAPDQLDGLDPRSDDQHGSESSRLFDPSYLAAKHPPPREYG